MTVTVYYKKKRNNAYRFLIEHRDTEARRIYYKFSEDTEIYKTLCLFISLCLKIKNSVTLCLCVQIKASVFKKTSIMKQIRKYLKQ